jgi:hypothetical protein
MNPPEPAAEAKDKAKKPEKGKLLVLLGPPTTTEAGTGLESFLAEFNVQVGKERLLSLLSNNPTKVLVGVNSALVNRNPVATAMWDLLERRGIYVYGVRQVQTGSSPEGPRGAGFVADPLLLAPAVQGVWAESNLTADATQLANALRRDRSALESKLSPRSVPVAVVVTEPAAPNMDPHAFMQPQPEGAARLAVFGNASMASNWSTAEGTGDYHYELIANTLDWLRGKPNSIGIEPKNRNLFTLDPETPLRRMYLLPWSLMILTVIGLGTGVWIIRRQ